MTLSGSTPAAHRPGPLPTARPNRAFPSSSSNTLLPHQTSDAQLPLTAAAGPSRRRLPHEIPEFVDAESEVEEVVEGFGRWRAISGEDVGVVMRRRAEAGYGLADVSHLSQLCWEAY